MKIIITQSDYTEQLICAMNIIILIQSGWFFYIIKGRIRVVTSVTITGTIILLFTAFVVCLQQVSEVCDVSEH